MVDFAITTDNMSDLPDSYLEEHGIACMYLTYMLGGESYDKDHKLPYQEFYDKMRKGAMPTTSQVNIEEAKDVFSSVLNEGKDILHIAFSSGLSGSCNNARLAAEELKESFPERKMIVIDSLCASLGEGLLVDQAVQLQQSGKTLEETASWIEEHKKNLCHMFTVDDLYHLHRGGRVSKTAAVVGTMINLKPLLHVDDEGHLIHLKNTRGRKKSLHSLVDMMGERIGSWKDTDQKIFISHGDCIEDARFVQTLVQEKFGYKNFLISPVGATIGAHSGPGTVALFFMGDYR